MHKDCFKQVQARNIQKAMRTMEGYVKVLSFTYYHHLKQDKTKVWLVVYDDGGYFMVCRQLFQPAAD